MAVPHASTTVHQSLHTTFSVPGRGNGSVTFEIQPDNDPEAYGTHLLFPQNNMSDYKAFPVCEATVKTEQRGYGSMYGWIQLFRSSDTTLNHDTPWQFDDVPVFKDLNTPFAWFGPEPRLFDGPSRIGITQIDWAARSFLTYIDDALLSKTVRPVVGFEWGFSMSDGVVAIKSAEKLMLTQWSDHIGLLSEQFPGWKFFDVDTPADVTQDTLVAN